ncbi:hypothetical protein IJF81_05045, partial [bacterium]|nr:hypothetical protein [bacterium]
MRSTSRQQKKKKTKRFDFVLYFLNGGFIIFAISLVIYLFFIQVIDIKNYRARAKNQRVGVIF